MKNISICCVLMVLLSLGCKKEEQREPIVFAALGYDAARLLIQAVEQSETIHPESVRLALTGIQDFPGVTGTISFGADSRIPSKSVTIMEVVDGSQQFVQELTPKKIPTP